MMLFGRWVRTLSRKSQDRIADTSARAGETLNAVQTVQAFTHEKYERGAFAATVESSFDVRHQPHPRPRRDDGGGDLRRLRQPRHGWSGRRAGRHRPPHDRRRRWCSSSSMAGWWRAASARCRETWGDLQRAAGASERLMELLHEQPAIARARASRSAAGAGARRGVSFEHVTFHYPSRPDTRRCNDFSLSIAAGRGGGAGRAVGRGQIHRVPADAAFLRGPAGQRPLRRHRYRRSRSGGAARRTSRWWRRIR